MDPKSDLWSDHQRCDHLNVAQLRHPDVLSSEINSAGVIGLEVAVCIITLYLEMTCGPNKAPVAYTCERNLVISSRCVVRLHLNVLISSRRAVAL